MVFLLRTRLIIPLLRKLEVILGDYRPGLRAAPPNPADHQRATPLARRGLGYEALRPRWPELDPYGHRAGRVPLCGRDFLAGPRTPEHAQESAFRPAAALARRCRGHLSKNVGLSTTPAGFAF